MVNADRRLAINDDDWWALIKSCFNGLSEEQQRFVVEQGYLPFGYVPEGECTNPVEVGIETRHDQFPGPRFYCRSCAMQFLTFGLPDL